MENQGQNTIVNVEAEFTIEFMTVERLFSIRYFLFYIAGAICYNNIIEGNDSQVRKVI